MNRINELREKKGLTQAQLGEVVGKSLHAISKWETGVNEPSHEDLINMSQFFGVSIDYILGVGKDNILSNRAEDFMNSSKGKYGEQGLKEAKEILDEIKIVFSGGKLPPEDMDAFFSLITKMYWEAKEKQKNADTK